MAGVLLHHWILWLSCMSPTLRIREVKAICETNHFYGHHATIHCHVDMAPYFSLEPHIPSSHSTA